MTFHEREAAWRARDEAKDALLRAAAALTERDDDALALALLLAAIGIMRIADADTGERAIGRVLAQLRGAMGRATP
jgi:hypothetical protein